MGYRTREIKRALYWWYMCRVPLFDTPRAVRENMTGFEVTYYNDMIKPLRKKPRLRLFKPRDQRKLAKIFNQDKR
jgi:hypothetical protein